MFGLEGMKPKELFAVARRFKLARRGASFFLVFVDFDEPVSQLLARPNSVRVEEDGWIWARFSIDDPRTGLESFLFVPYCPELGAFVHEVEPKTSHLCVEIPGLKYYTPEERKMAVEKWKSRKEISVWQESKSRPKRSPSRGSPLSRTFSFGDEELRRHQTELFGR